jgi:hypothetical protein
MKSSEVVSYLQNRHSIAVPEPSPEVLSVIRRLVQRTCDHTNLWPTGPDRLVYQCANCGHEAHATFGHVVRWRDDA